MDVKDTQSEWDNLDKKIRNKELTENKHSTIS